MLSIRQERCAGTLLRTVRIVAAGAVLAACAGCWDEVPYNGPPPAEPAASALPSANPEAAAEPEPETATETTLVPPADAAAAPTASELFGDGPGDAQVATTIAVPPPVAEEVVDDPAAKLIGADFVVREPTLTTNGEAPPLDLVTPQQRLDAWTVASDWSLSAAFRARGLNPDHYGNFTGEAQRAAAALGIDLPALPEGEASEDAKSAAIATLPTGAGVELVAAIAERTDDSVAAAAQLALDAHRLLLVYMPQSDAVPALAAAIRAAGERSRLPAKLWLPLAELLDRRADFKSVRGTVFALRNAVTEHLAAEALTTPLAHERSGS